MADVLLIAVILAFFLAAGQVVRACGRITASAAEDVEPELDPTSEPEQGRPA